MINSLISKLQATFEQKIFGVCEWLGSKLGIKSTRIRMYFIYLSFFTAGSPVLIYFMLAFLLEHKHYFKPGRVRAQRLSIWDI